MIDRSNRLVNVGGQLTFSSQFLESSTSQRSSHFQTFGNNRWRNQLVAGHFLEQLVVGGLVEEDQVVQFVAGLSL